MWASETPLDSLTRVLRGCRKGSVRVQLVGPMRGPLQDPKIHHRTERPFPALTLRMQLRQPIERGLRDHRDGVRAGLVAPPSPQGPHRPPHRVSLVVHEVVPAGGAGAVDVVHAGHHAHRVLIRDVGQLAAQVRIFSEDRGDGGGWEWGQQREEAEAEEEEGATGGEVRCCAV